MDRTASHKDPFQNMCLFVCSCCSKKKKAGLFCDELGSYVTLCFYVTSLVSTWKSTINSFNGFFPPSDVCHWFEYWNGCKGNCCLEYWIVIWNGCCYIQTTHLCAPHTTWKHLHFRTGPLRIMIAFTLEEEVMVILHCFWLRSITARAKTEIRPAVMRKAAICFLKPFVLQFALLSPPAIWERCLCI